MATTVIVVSVLVWIMGGPVWLVGVAALVALSPTLGLAAVILGIIVTVMRARWDRDRTQDPASQALRSLADEMGAGRTFAHALLAVGEPIADRSVRRLVHVGADASTLAQAAGRSLGPRQSTFVAAVALSEVAGSSLADHLHHMADVAEVDESIERDRRVASAQARFSAIVVGVVPLVVAGAVVLLRGIPEPGGAPVVIPMAAGASLLLTGSVAVAWMSGSRRSP